MTNVLWYIRNFLTCHYVVLLVILSVGIFLRIWHFGDFLHFELDQARDAYVVFDSLGSNQLPDKGPMARGSSLFLGPAFYWIQITSVVVLSFFDTIRFPLIEMIAFPDLFFGILGLIVSHFLVRRYFSDFVALSTTALLASSLFLVTYSRFAWNPNAMFFWSVLLVFLLSVIVSVEKQWLRYCIVTLIALSVAILIQLHFIAFLCLPLIVMSYFLITRAAHQRSVIVCGILAFAFFAGPLIGNEFRTGGETMQQLFLTVTEKNEKDSAHTIPEKVFRAAQETVGYFSIAMISDNHGRGIVRTVTDGEQFFMCDDTCKERFPFLVISSGIFLLALIAFIRIRSNIPTEIWVLSVLWFISGFLFLTLVAYQISPRFYLFMMPSFLILWASFLDFLSEKIGKSRALFFVIILIIFNLVMVYKDFRVASNSQIDPIDAPRDVMLARDDRVTLGALRRAADALIGENQQFVLVGDNRYARALYYLLDVEQGNGGVLCYAKRAGFPSNVYDTSRVWLLAREKSDEPVPKALSLTHSIDQKIEFGTIALYKLTPNTETIISFENLPEKCFVR